MKKSIAIVDYGMGNLRSVQKALEKVGARARVTDSPGAVRAADAVVLPGVGAFGEAVRRLKSQRLWDPLLQTLSLGKPFLGICLGLQLLFEDSEEDPRTRGLGFLKGSVVRFRSGGRRKLKIPHMGWNTIQTRAGRPAGCLRGIGDRDYFYFVHSYYPDPADKEIVATRTDYGKPFCSSVQRDSLFACQFHPEKSGAPGLRLLRSFVRQASAC